MSFILQCAVDFLGRDAAIPIAFIIIILIVALSQMLARTFGRHDWQAWSNDQLYQAAFTIFIAANLAFFAVVGCQFSNWAVGGDAFELSKEYLNGLIHSGERTTLALFNYKYFLEFISSYKIKMGPNPNTAIPIFPVMGIAANIDNISWFFPVAIANLMVQRIILEVTEQIALAVVLPMGVILRIFPMTRNAGSFLMAAAFGMYVIFPVTYVFSSMALANVEPPGMWWLNPVDLPDGIFQVIRHIGNLGGGLAIGRIFMFDFGFFLQTTFLPALSMLVTVTFIRSVSKFLVKGFDLS